jgi:hypothetical protein
MLRLNDKTRKAEENGWNTPFMDILSFRSLNNVYAADGG